MAERWIDFIGEEIAMHCRSFSPMAAALLALFPLLAPAAEPATYNVRTLVPETALKIAQVALQTCRDKGHQVAVAVVDRGGLAQVMLRDRLAGAHTPETAIGKAWTAVSFRVNTRRWRRKPRRAAGQRPAPVAARRHARRRHAHRGRRCCWRGRRFRRTERRT
jgi:uncharacterized protein GlcG (DUF336 family)